MPEDSVAQESEVLRASCSCGKEWEREADAANLPRQRNESILDSTVGAHEFTHEWRDDDYQTERGWIDA